MKYYFIFLSALLFFPINFVIGQDKAYPLKDKEYGVFNTELIEYLEYYKDPQDRNNPGQLNEEEFTKAENYIHEDYQSEKTYWFRLKLKNESALYKLWYFEITDPHIQHIRSFIIQNNDTLLTGETGFHTPFDTRSSRHKNFLIPIRFNESDTVELYLAVKNNYKADLSIAIRPAEQFQDYALNEYLFLGLFYGILCIMALYNLFIYFSTKESVYLFYVSYVLCYCLNSFREDGIGFQFLWPEFPQLNPFIHSFAPLLLIISFVLYSKKFLKIKKYSGRLNNWINYALATYILLFCLNYFWDSQLLTYSYLIPFVLVFYTCLISLRKGNYAATYFLFGFAFLMSCLTVFILRINNIIPTTVLTVYALNFGFLIEVVVFSYALGQRLKYDKEEKAKTDQLLISQLRENEKLKDTLNKELEAKVQERTIELEKALNQLQDQNDQIEQLNKLLEKDNKALNQDIKDITKARLMLKDLTFEEFQKIYPDEISCLKYLAEIKWSKGYQCKKCGNQVSSDGKKEFSKRCTKCGYDESATTDTLFHNSKIPLHTTFYLVYLVMANRQISSHELSEKLGLRQKTCWGFKKKIEEAVGRKRNSRVDSKDWGKIFYN